MSELPDELIDSLLAEEAGPKTRHRDTPVKPIPPKAANVFDPEKRGPVVHHDKEMRCSMRGCSSPTYIRVMGISMCYAHALRRCNDMLMDAGFRGV